MKSWPLLVFPLVSGVAGAVAVVPTAIVVDKASARNFNKIICQSKQKNISLSSSLSKLRKDDDLTDITITVKNNRNKLLSGASITILVRDKDYINIPLEDLTPGAEVTHVTSRNKINEQLIKQELQPISLGDSIKFLLVKENSYSVKNNRLLIADKLNNFNFVSDDDLSQLPDGSFLAYDATNDDYELKQGFSEYEKALPSGNYKYHVYLIKGVFEITSGSDATMNLYLHGILDSRKNKLSTFKLYNGEEWDPSVLPEAAQKSPSGTSNANLYLDNINVLARTKYTGNFYQNGYQCPALECTNCDFRGAYTVYTYNAKFNYCNFDSRECLYVRSGADIWRGTECVWIYSDSYASFDHCYFLNSGKAIKIYTEASTCSNQNTNKFTDCTFEYDKKYVDEWWEQHKTEPYGKPEIKQIFELDTTHLGEGYWSRLEITRAKKVGYIIDDKEKELIHDDKEEYIGNTSHQTKGAGHYIVVDGVKPIEPEI